MDTAKGERSYQKLKGSVGSPETAAGLGGRGTPEWGTEPHSIEVSASNQMLRVGEGVTVALEWFLNPVVRDQAGHPVKNQELIWISDQPAIAAFPDSTEGRLIAHGK